MCLFWLFLLLAPSVAAAQETPETGSLEGRVLHALTREPVPRAALTLTLEGRPGHPLEARPPERQASTDADGRFRFDALPPGRYYLRARKAGFLFQYYNPLPRGSGAASPHHLRHPASLKKCSLFPQAVVQRPRPSAKTVNQPRARLSPSVARYVPPAAAGWPVHFRPTMTRRVSLPRSLAAVSGSAPRPPSWSEGTPPRPQHRNRTRFHSLLLPQRPGPRIRHPHRP
ncbi:MAG: carboxypeptidase regulatory-like domain-containing protein [Solibacteraceae bacterium]|nr:carboxypeptidase regulatory-like domain-containing protein [Solibacteraceae bacterium]